VTSILKTDQAVISDKRSDEQNLSYFPTKYNKKSMYLVGHVAQAFIKSTISCTPCEFSYNNFKCFIYHFLLR